MDDEEVEDLLLASFPFYTARDLIDDYKRGAHHDDLDALGICPKHHFNREMIAPLREAQENS